MPAGAVHRESNPSDEPARAVIVRCGTGDPTYNIDGPASDGRMMFGPLDFVYLPEPRRGRRPRALDRAPVASAVFAVERFDTRVAMRRRSATGPAVLFAEHLEGDRPVLLYRVDDLGRGHRDLPRRGVEVGERFEFPYGEAVELISPGPQRVAIYERTRADRGDSLRGRRDF